MKRTLGLFTAVALAAVITGYLSPARADVVSPPDSGACPDGTDPVQSHGLDPAACIPRSCASDSDCSSGMSCVDRKLCSYATAECSSDGDCQGSSKCEAVKVCSSKGGCAVAPSSGEQGPLALGLLALALFARRRR
ncbi:MAG: MYXO-CTERM sorting domain-containing protein [Nannocystaceae bacterium]|nr:hypothetical protein [Myxococcales bacterium]